MVPLRLFTADNTISLNKTLSSVHFCKPVKFHFVKETPEITMTIYNRYSQLLDKNKTY